MNEAQLQTSSAAFQSATQPREGLTFARTFLTRGRFAL